MTSRDFCYWLQGYFEIALADGQHTVFLTPAQINTLKSHLAMVFRHEIDPSMGDQEHQTELNEIHEGGSVTPQTPFSQAHQSPGVDELYRC